jgi:cell division protein FtsI/penicillin-binding protein 2
MEANRKSFERLAERLHTSYDSLKEQLIHLKSPVVLVASDGGELVLNSRDKKEIEAWNIPGVHAVESDQRTMFHPLAQQVIGLLVPRPRLMKQWYPDEVESGKWNPHSLLGISGLERSFEPFLHGDNEELLVYTATASGQPLNGVRVRLKKLDGGNGSPPQSIVTTLDKEIQQRVEKIMDEEGVRTGAVVVQDISNGDILAMASRPSGFAQASENGPNPWDNRAVMEEVPGSIFKTVVAVAALDKGLVQPDTLFDCQVEDKSIGLSDSELKTHVRETFAQAFANSCNTVLGRVAVRLGGETLEAYAKRLGIGQAAIWTGPLFHDPSFKQFPLEQTGKVFAPKTSRKDIKIVAKTGIGQYDVRLTPLQAANLVTALFHQGVPFAPRLVSEIRDGTGHVVVTFPVRTLPGSKPIPESVLTKVRKMMRSVVTSGTAVSVTGSRWPLAGKTGTAQVRKKVDEVKGEQQTDNREEQVMNSSFIYNKWMIGFGPYSSPRYAMAVLLSGVPDPNDPRAKRIFKRVMDELAAMESAGLLKPPAKQPDPGRTSPAKKEEKQKKKQK